MIRVEVLKTDLMKGIAYDSTACPLARAIQRTLRKNKLKDWRIAISEDIRFFTASHSERVIVDTPPRLARFIKKFDEGADKSKLKPFVFCIKGVSIRGNSVVAT